MPEQAPLRAGIYTRISLAVLGDMTKVDDQERICRDLAGRLGWEVVDVYCDHSKSAWQKKRNRPAWNRMLRDVDDRRINAIVVYHGDRLVRRPEDLADLIRLADGKGVRLASPTGTKDLDRERAELWIRAAFAEEESQRTSERRQAQYDRWRREGRVRPGGRGGRAFGFATDGITHIPEETKIVREAAGRVLAGESTGAIARDLSARGVRTPAGNSVTHGTLSKMLARPRYAGLMPDAKAKAAWEPVLDRETWEAVRAQLTVRAMVVPRPSNVRRWLLSGIAECGAPDGKGGTCGSALQINAAHKRRHSEGPAYRCVTPGCRKVHRRAEFVDAYVTGRVVRRLQDPAVAQASYQATPTLAAELLTLTERRAEAEQVIASYADRPERLSVLARALDSIDDRIAMIREQITADSGRRILARHAGITREVFKALPLDTRRALVAACYRVVVLPAGRRGPGFDPATVELTPREATA